ncbi:MAG TPA: oligoribonuclease [Mycobacteriales bacterium]|nr:oligoribonuclease [Mycobacteriales bacterium]
MQDRLVWIDLEMTGLDPDNDVILEIAVLVTDSELEPVGDGIDLVVSQPAEKLETMVPVVVDMHSSSGLTDAVKASTLSLADAEAQVLAWLKDLVPEQGRAPLCGNSIATDRGFLVKHMPELDSWMHYRMIDVSSIKELARRWYPQAYGAAPVKGGGHRALADIKESVAELRYYRSAIFVPRAEKPSAVAAPADGPAQASS